MYWTHFHSLRSTGFPRRENMTRSKAALFVFVFCLLSIPVPWILFAPTYNSSPSVPYIKLSRSRQQSISSTTAHALTLSRSAFSPLFTRRLVSRKHIDAHDIGASYATFCTVKRVSNCRCRIGYLCAINHVDIGDAGLCAETLKHCK